MKYLTEYINIKVKPSLIHADNKTIQNIMVDEVKRLGKTADFNHVDTSKVTSFHNLFNTDKEDGGHNIFEKFNGDISKWNTSKVEDMGYCFYGCYEFNCDISNWDVSKVTDFEAMFHKCKKFNQPIGKWNISKAQNMFAILAFCDSFYQDLSSWDLKNVKKKASILYKSELMLKNKKYQPINGY